MYSVKNKFLIFFSLFLASCLGPVKELKYQIEDSFDDSPYYIDNPSQLNEIKNKFSINLDKEINLGEKSNRNFFLAKIDNFLFYASADGLVYSINIYNFEEQWNYKHSTKIVAGLSSNSDLVFFVDYDGFLCALGINGTLQWKIFVGEVLAPPLALSNYVVIRTTENEFLSLRTLDGSLVWNYKTQKNLLNVRSWGSLIISDDVVYSGISSGKIIALNLLNGSLIWETTYSQPSGTSDIQRSSSATSQPLSDEFFLYIVSNDGNIASISKRDGSVLWSRPLSSFSGITSDQNNIFVTHSSGAIYSIAKETSKVLWRNPDLLGRDVSRGYLYKNFLIYYDYEGYLHVLDKVNGEIISRMKVSDTLLSPLIYFEEKDKLLFSSLNGEIYSIAINFSDDLDLKKPQKNTSNSNNIEPILEPSKTEESFIDKLIFWD
jgi:outer membrane protein assembly factor BamB